MEPAVSAPWQFRRIPNDRTAYNVIGPHHNGGLGSQMVTVMIIGQLQQHVDEPQLELELPSNPTVKGLLEANEDALGVVGSFAISGQLMVTVNKKISTLESTLKDGDVVKLTYQANFSYEGARWHNP